MDMVHLARGGFWITFGQTVSTILSLALVVAFANMLPKEIYGTYRYILSIAGVLNIFTLTGMSNAVARAVAKGDEGALRTSVHYQIKWNILMIVAFFSLAGYYLLNGDKQFATSFFVLGIFVPLTLALNTFGSYLEGKNEFKFASISNIISAFMYTTGSFVALLLSGEVVWLIVAYAITTFATTFYYYIRIVQKYKLPITDSPDTIKYGRELSFIGFIGPISSQLDKIILAHFWGPAQLAVYSLALAIPDRITSHMKNWISIGTQKFSTKTPSELNSVFYKRIFQGMFVGTFVSISYILVSPYLFKYLLPKYLDGVLYSQIIAISFIFALPSRYTSLLFVSQKMSRIIFINSVVQNTIRILLFTILGTIGGILGLTIANLASTILGLIINIIFWKRNTATEKPIASQQ